MYSLLDILEGSGTVVSPRLEVSDEVRTEVTSKVQHLLGEYYVSEETYNEFSLEERVKHLQMLSLFYCNSEQEIELFWESFNSGSVNVTVEGGEIIRMSQLIYSYRNYTLLLKAIYFYECKKFVGDKAKKRRLH